MKKRLIKKLIKKLIELGYAEEGYYAGEIVEYEVGIPSRWGLIQFSIDAETFEFSPAWIDQEGGDFLVTDSKEQLIEAMKLLVEEKFDEINELFEANCEPLDP